jgi:hypothetical protein
VTEHEAKKEIVLNQFQSIIGRGEPRRHFNWEGLHFQDAYLQTLRDPFSEEEGKNAINQMSSDKAPESDIFTQAFFGRCWVIIKGCYKRCTIIWESTYGKSLSCSLVPSSMVLN